MPWKIVKHGSQWAVVKKDGGKVMGVHATEAKAKRQLGALYANAKPEEIIK